MSGKGRSSCPYYDELDAILGTRAASQPVALLESSANQSDSVVVHGAETTEDAGEVCSDDDEQGKVWLVQFNS